MIDHFPFYLGLVVIILLLIMLANKIKVAYPVLLVLAGLLISFVPWIPNLHIDSELIFIIFLPPLLYDAAWQISWKELWHWRRVIGSFAFVVVLITALAVALAANYFIPGFSLALGFLLGAIVSPPDAVSAGAILKFVKVPQRISSILEGESLLNDASSLIVFRFALLAVGTGQFIWQQAAFSFLWMVAGGIGCGLLVGYVIMKMHKFLPTDANMDIILTLVTPHAIYIIAEATGSSGVLAVVAGGLLLSNRRLVFLTSTSRLRYANVWESLSFILNGLVFIIIGLDLPQITAELETVSIMSAIGYGLLITAVLIITRLISAYGAVVVTLIARNYIPVADTRHPGLKGPFIIGWAGMRGVVSLAAALSIPVHLENGTLFPERNLILFITFIVILTTLLLQGLTLPVIIKRFKLTDPDYDKPEEEMYQNLRRQLNQLALTHLQQNYHDKVGKYPVLQQMAQKWQEIGDADTVSLAEEPRDIYREILEKQRQWLVQQNREQNAVIEDVIRRHLLFLDLEEEKMRYFSY
ncbi:sodium/proton antiporter (CPA1 family) [Arcticibacter tournemirensis]|uniref:Na+/H+ antiporter n=1 Tax=Arcticibacter tournemirensis TaxID=699437 RepID=A0A5M9GUV0_9SPHI|nr:Na+/H+ antiporter [Arcticibacter tournemirensis]KAA8478493.1 Na+/H+ antiporter [Arcticibacter tournemirensis]TQM51160.1 sodium/proton antiporter (CPA1 family) [Arcticibacter tournemirensis]